MFLFEHFSCDADPAALAKYVVALVKKDKPVQELKDICIDQLEVFLSDGKMDASQNFVLKWVRGYGASAHSYPWVKRNTVYLNPIQTDCLFLSFLTGRGGGILPLHNFATIDSMTMRIGGQILLPKMFSLRSAMGDDDII